MPDQASENGFEKRLFEFENVLGKDIGRKIASCEEAFPKGQ
jgi:hypothetical protein